jgi:hypothetical protein
VVIDASDPAAPRLAGRSSWQVGDDWYPSEGFWAHGIPGSNRSSARFDGGVASLESRWVSDSDRTGHEEFRLRVIDLRDLSEIGLRTIDLPSRNGYSGLRVDGDTLVTSHFEPIAGRDASRFYLDRIDVGDPSAPVLRNPINVPGIVMHYDAQEGLAVTMDVLRVEQGVQLTWQECGERFATFEFEYDLRGDSGTCIGYQQVVRLVSIDGDVARLQDSHEVDVEHALRRLEAGDGRLVGTTGRSDGYGYGRYAADIACAGPCGGYGYGASEPEQLLVFSGYEDGELRTGTLELSVDANPWWGWWGASNLVAAGRRALVTSSGELAIIDLSDAEHPVVEQTAAFSGQTYGVGVSVAGDRVVLALGAQGCRVIDM